MLGGGGRHVWPSRSDGYKNYQSGENDEVAVVGADEYNREQSKLTELGWNSAPDNEERETRLNDRNVIGCLEKEIDVTH